MSKKTIGVFGTCRISKYKHPKLENINDRKFINKKYEIYTQPIHYTTSTREVIQSLKILDNRDLIKNIENNKESKEFKNMFYFTINREPMPDVTGKFDSYIFEICSIKNVITDYKLGENITIPYKPVDKDIKYERMNETMLETCQNFNIINELVGDKPVLLFGPLLIKSLPNDVLEKRKYLVSILNKWASENENITFINLSNIIYKLGYARCMKDQYHYSDFFVEYQTKIILQWIEKNMDL